eukprot:gb/GFBE01016925.1/.p1 GENE.gb/GFBE01016925.1/~~gb/GFBE01016925.1/.p1  ORF type:complete len:225 (+),score=42.09 gb/GFBE01016925.1/:1-675(+)
MPTIEAPRTPSTSASSDDEDCLEWTISPVSRKQIEGFAECWVTLPRVEPGADRSHALHIKRELEIQPAKQRFEKPPLPAAAKAGGARQTLRVTESDFLKFGGDLSALRQHALDGERVKYMSGRGFTAATALREEMRLVESTLHGSKSAKTSEWPPQVRHSQSMIREGGSGRPLSRSSSSSSRGSGRPVSRGSSGSRDNQSSPGSLLPRLSAARPLRSSASSPQL